MVSKSLALTVDGRTYQVEVIRPGMISVDGNVFNIERTGNGVTVDGEALVARMSEGFSIVGGKLYETEWQVK